MRREARVLALQFLWSQKFNPGSAMNLDFLELIDLKDSLEFSKQLVESVIQHQADLDSLISNKVANWTLDRIYLVDLTILRLAISEITHLGTPRKVAINEYLEIAKEFSDQKSFAFINGILDNF